MTRNKTASLLLALAMAAGGTPAFAQPSYDPAMWGRYGNDALPDPPQALTGPVYTAATATATMAQHASAGAFTAAHRIACTALNPCAVPAPASRA